MSAPRRIILGISGGIAACKVPQIIRLLKKRGMECRIVATESALSLVSEASLRVLSGNPVYSEIFSKEHSLGHISLSKWGDLFLVCPATANTIAKISHGIADNLLTTSLLAFEGTIMVAPSMNSVMWQKKITQENVKRCKKQGIKMLPVASGELACGESGPGRMLSPQSIADCVLYSELPECLSGKKVVITSGPTREPVDAVRTLTNRSSGRMGEALSRAAVSAGADVSVVSGPVSVQYPETADVFFTETSKEMEEKTASLFRTADICIMAAAVSDYKPVKTLAGKLDRKKAGSFSIELAPTSDISMKLGKKKNGRFLVCFALEETNDEKRALKKLKEKNCDMIILNTIAESLNRKDCKISIIYPDRKSEDIPVMSKKETAGVIIKKIAQSIKRQK